MPNEIPPLVKGIDRITVGNALDWPGYPIGAASALNGVVWTAGVISSDPKTGDIIRGDIESQTERALENLDLILGAVGCTRRDVVMIQAFLADIRRDFEGFNLVYSRYFDEDAPPRFSVGVTLAVEELLVELHAIARVG